LLDIRSGYGKASVFSPKTGCFRVSLASAGSIALPSGFAFGSAQPSFDTAHGFGVEKKISDE